MSKRLQTVALVSLGCAKNLVDSEKMLAGLAQAGYVVGAPMDRADVIVVNTCGFIAPARAESLEVIAEALEHKRRGRARRVVVAGCLVNREWNRLYQLSPGIDAIVGVNDRDALLSAVAGRGRVSLTSPYHTAADGRGAIASDAGRFRLTPRHTAYLRICEGCSQRCTFCTIPAMRGPYRSKPPQQVLAEAAELVADGAVELNVIGQDITSYGRDLPGRWTLGRLLRGLEKIDRPRWIRLLYAYPMRFSDALIDLMADSQRIVPYVDLPLQHIAEPILRRMGRGVGRSRIERLLGRLREKAPGVAIRTTFIVGFPGETEGHFRELLEFVRAFRFEALGVFEFCPEEGTAAARMDRQVPQEVKTQRAEAIMQAQRRIVLEAGRRMVGRELQVLVDGVDAAGRCVGRHAGQAPDIDGVCLLDRRAPAGRFVAARVVAPSGYDLRVRCV
jgi:ribosomal protein S12 methylthiotransferase